MYYRFVAYGVDPATERIDMDEVRKLALEHRPKILLAGYSAYSRELDYEAFRSIADEVEAVFMVDAAHFIGLVAGGSYPNPVPHADIVTATTHKALRGPRGGMVLCKEEFAAAVDKAVFPNAQGGPIMSQIAAKAVCFHEAAQPAFRDYTERIVANARAMAGRMGDEGVRVVSGGTDNHLFLVDLRSVDEELTGRDAARLLDQLGITLNFNTIPFDPRPPYRASGLRMGTPAMTTQGFEPVEAAEVAHLVARALQARHDRAALAGVESRVRELATAHPPYPEGYPGHV
jgi:glycine hydroxymethyltransferase